MACLPTLGVRSAPVKSAPTPKAARRSALTFARKFPQDMTPETYGSMLRVETSSSCVMPPPVHSKPLYSFYWNNPVACVTVCT